MTNKIQDFSSEIQYLYACIAYIESSSDDEIVIKTETKLSKVYPVKKIVQGMESVGEDYWGRYSFKDSKGQYYCELDGALYFKGNSMDGEPHYPVKEVILYDFPDVDSELINFNELIDKVKKFDVKKYGVKLTESKPYLQMNSNNIMESKIICFYHFKVL
jgi:hypothetical protein